MKFSQSNSNGYVVLYFTPSDGKIWYDLEYQVNFGPGTGGNTVGASAGSALSSGACVMSGTDVTFTQTNSTGYTFSEWNSAENGSGTQRSTNTSYTATINSSSATSGAYTTYSQYTENKSSITISAGTGGSITGGGSNISLGVATKRAISATADPGYYFVRWDVTGTAAVDNATSASTNAKTDGTSGSSGTVTAVFALRYAVYGSVYGTDVAGSGMPGWSDNSKTLEYQGTNDFRRTLRLDGNKKYKFRIHDIFTGANLGGGSEYNVDLNGTRTTFDKTGGDVTFSTEGSGDITFKIDGFENGYPQVRVLCDFSSYTVTFAQHTDCANDATLDDSDTGGSVTAVDGYDVTLSSTEKVKSGGSVTFTASVNPGYSFAGWYTDAACTEGHTMTNPLTVSSISANTARYAKFTENMTSVSVHTYLGTVSINGGEACDGTTAGNYIEVGVHTTATLAIASTNEGYYFSNWDLSAAGGEDVNFSISGSATNEDNTSVTITGLGAASSRLNFLYPEFKQLETIYFRNEFKDGETITKWDNVYAFFGTYWEDYSGQQCVKTNSANNTKGLHVQMTAVGSRNLYRAYVPRWATRQGWTNIAFASADNSSNNGYLYECKAVGRGDYNKELNLFVPYHTPNKTNANKVDYYDNGFWMVNNILDGEDSGYELWRRTGSKTYEKYGEFSYISKGWETPTIQYRLRIDGSEKKDYLIKSKAGTKYKANATITTAKYENVRIIDDNNNDDAYFTITITTQGEYILTIDQSADTMKLSVNYPVAVGDYMIEHRYVGKAVDGTTDSTYITHSNVIKATDIAAASAAGTKLRHSMYLSKSLKDKTAETLKLRKCESISGAGIPSWSAGSATNLDAVLTKLASDGNGVYQFDIMVSADAVSAIDSIKPYTGEYYIKADSTKGGWAIYTSNPMAKNTLTFRASDPTTFNYYWCYYYYTNSANIKCVIANEYCNQLSDTLYADGIARMVAGEPYVPIAKTSIRYSYNSTTNKVARAYLGASTNYDYLDIVPAAEAGKVYDTDDLDLNGADTNKRRFDDKENWIYEKDLKVVPGGKAGVTATYNGNTQTFLTSDKVLLGGSGASSYPIHVIYDFKTNYLMSAFFLPEDGIISNPLSDVNMVWVRHADEDPIQVTFSGTGALTVINPVGAIELKYDEMYRYASNPIDLTRWTPINRPYLKYFISFPFSVPVASIFGLNEAELGREYDIQKYNGEKRAKEGLFFGDGDNYWENLTLKDTLHAYEGYCVILDNEYVSGLYGHIWDKMKAGSSVYMYFPSSDTIDIELDDKTVKIADHKCKIDRAWSQSSNKNHINTDSHWNLIGNPLFHNANIKDTTASDTFKLRSYYYLDYSDNTWKTRAITKGSTEFKAMSCVFVQWCGNLKWAVHTPPSPIVARRANDESKNYLLQLNVGYNGSIPDWTYIKLEDCANDEFILREDMMKLYNKSIPQIYSFAGDYDLAYNTLELEDHIVPIGLIARKNGNYTFSMPNNFSGTVTLIDKYAQTRTNLALEDYEVYLNKGTIEDRFEIEIDINKVPTAIDGAEDCQGTFKDGKAHKFIQNGQMYILCDGVIYDARGTRVQ